MESCNANETHGAASSRSEYAGAKGRWSSTVLTSGDSRATPEMRIKGKDSFACITSIYKKDSYEFQSSGGVYEGKLLATEERRQHWDSLRGVEFHTRWPSS